MNILLIGCTGFLGQALIYKILTQTTHTIYLAIRPKNNRTISDRLRNIMRSIKLDGCDTRDNGDGGDGDGGSGGDDGGNRISYTDRIRLIHTTYDDNRDIIISTKDRRCIIKNVDVVINALADIKFNRELRKAVLNNTVTALNWMKLFQICKKAKTYVYVSSAFVNFHRGNNRDRIEIPEKILETNMSADNLTNILQRTQTGFGEYCNTYLYSKQLAEVLLAKERRHKKLVIVRPSIIIPALTEPYPGWGKIQTISFAILGAASGILSLYKIDWGSYQNTVPVDIVAEDCLQNIYGGCDSGGGKELEHGNNIDIRHACLTGNVANWFTSAHKFKTDVIDKAYAYFKNKPLVINNRVLIPFKMEIKNSFIAIIINIILHIFKMIYHWYKWSVSWTELFRMIYKNMMFNYKFNKTFMKFTQKKMVFKRRVRENDIIYTDKTYEECIFSFVKRFQDTIQDDDRIMKMF
jgi:nucleoside-diphosphate-sugar epimerase